MTLGLDLMEKADSETTTLRKFKTYRDGLMIGLLASRQLRLRNLAASSARKKSPPVVAASDTAAVNSTFRSAVTEERLLPFTALSDRCVLRRLCRLACI